MSEPRTDWMVERRYPILTYARDTDSASVAQPSRGSASLQAPASNPASILCSGSARIKVLPQHEKTSAKRSDVKTALVHNLYTEIGKRSENKRWLLGMDSEPRLTAHSQGKSANHSSQVLPCLFFSGNSLSSCGFIVDRPHHGRRGMELCVYRFSAGVIGGSPSWTCQKPSASSWQRLQRSH